MATSLHTIIPYPTRFSSRRPEPTRLKATPSSSSSWWTPLFGWSSDPDYTEQVNGAVSEPAKTRFEPGRFTEEKAKELRRKTRETVSFHDVMYHSAIASKLVSDVADS